MSKTDFELPPLPPDITALLAAEKGGPGLSQGAQTRMLGAICTTLGLPLPVGPGPGPSGGGDGGATAGGMGPGATETAGGHGLGAAMASAVKPATLIAFAVGITVGAGTVAVIKRDTGTRPAITSPQVPTPTPTQSESPLPAVASASQPATRPVQANKTVSTRVAPKPFGTSASAKLTRGTLDAERSLLEMARAALSRGRAADALRTLGQHRTKYPASHLAEERDALTILALIADGNLTEAKARAARFSARYPKSLLRSVVEDGLQKAERTW